MNPGAAGHGAGAPLFPPLPFIRGGFACVVADPPWSYDSGKASRIRPRYDTLTVQRIAEIPIAGLVAREALLFLWTTPSFAEAAHSVARSWGFRPKAEIVWVKGRIDSKAVQLRLQIGMGSYVRNAHETVLVCSRGGLTGAVRDVPSVLLAPRTEHSSKPEELQDIAERLGPGPRLELFARRQRPGWVCWGDEA